VIPIVFLDDEPYDEICATSVNVAASSKESIMTAAEKFIQQGRAEGRVKTLTKLVVAKFGGLSKAHQDRLDNATDEELDQFIERVLTADSLDALLGK